MIPPIFVKIFGKDGVSSKLAGIQRKLSKFGSSAKTVGTTMSVGLSVPMGLFGINTLKTAGDFEYGMNRVKAITSATGADFEKLRTQAKHLGETTTFTAGQVTDGMQMLAQAGMPVEDIYANVGTVLKGAQANMVDMAETANIGAGLMKTFGYDSKEMIDVMDLLSKTSISSMTNFTDLSEAFLYAGPTAGAMGKNLKETSAVLAGLAQGMMKGSMAGTSLRGIMAKLTAPSAEAVSIMQGLGIAYDDILDKRGNMKSFVDVIKTFEGTSVTAGQVLEIFGLRAGPGFQILLNQGSEALSGMLGKLGEFKGTTERLSKVQMQGFKGQMWALTSAFEGFQIAIADSGILMFATKLAKKVTKLFQVMAKFHPKILKFVFVIGLLVAAIGPLLVAMGAVAASVAVISWPVTLVVLGIVALIAAFTALVIWWDQIIDFTVKWGWALGLLLGPIGWLAYAAALIIKNWDKVAETFANVWEWAKKLGDAISNMNIVKIAELLGLDSVGAPGGGGYTSDYGVMPGVNDYKTGGTVTVDFKNVPKDVDVITEDDTNLETVVGRGAAFALR